MSCLYVHDFFTNLPAYYNLLVCTIGSDQSPLLHEFEFLEDFGHSTRDEIDLGGETDHDWKPEDCHSSNHTVKLMVRILVVNHRHLGS